MVHVSTQYNVNVHVNIKVNGFPFNVTNLEDYDDEEDSFCFKSFVFSFLFLWMTWFLIIWH
jgi:hypothetical protein